MANDYLKHLHQFISRELDAARSAAAEAVQSGDTARSNRFRGRVEALQQARVFLTDRYDLANHRYY